jgi:hypothetical protein
LNFNFNSKKKKDFFRLLLGFLFPVLFLSSCNNVIFDEKKTESTSVQPSLLDLITPQALLPQNCTFNGETVLNNESVKAYKNSHLEYNQKCETADNMELRKCTDGTLAGTFTESTCGSKIPVDCMFNGYAIAHGASFEAYLKKSLPYDADCDSAENKETRTCLDGTITGSFTELSCSLEVQKVGITDPDWKTISYILPAASHLIVQPDKSLILIGSDVLLDPSYGCAKSCSTSMSIAKFNSDGTRSTEFMWWIHQKAAGYTTSTGGGLRTFYDQNGGTGLVVSSVIKGDNNFTLFGSPMNGTSAWGPNIQVSRFTLEGKNDYSFQNSSDLGIPPYLKSAAHPSVARFPDTGGNTYLSDFSDLDLLPSQTGYYETYSSSKKIEKYIFATGKPDLTFASKGSLILTSYLVGNPVDLHTSKTGDDFITVMSSSLIGRSTYSFLKFDDIGTFVKKSDPWTIPLTYTPASGGALRYEKSLYLADESVLFFFSAYKKEGLKQSSGYVVVKFTPQGVLDKTFGDAGVAWIQISPVKVSIAYQNSSLRLLQQKNGQIYIVAVGTADGIDGTSVVRMNTNGTLDPKNLGIPKDAGVLKIRNVKLAAQSTKIKVSDSGIALSADERYLYIAFTTEIRRIILK